jgi:hypothetical protein
MIVKQSEEEISHATGRCRDLKTEIDSLCKPLLSPVFFLLLSYKVNDSAILQARDYL